MLDHIPRSARVRARTLLALARRSAYCWVDRTAPAPAIPEEEGGAGSAREGRREAVSRGRRCGREEEEEEGTGMAREGRASWDLEGGGWSDLEGRGLLVRQEEEEMPVEIGRLSEAGSEERAEDEVARRSPEGTGTETGTEGAVRGAAMRCTRVGG